jgi:hypothetical protein
MRLITLTICLATFLWGGSLVCADSSTEQRAGLLLETMTYDWCHGDCGPFNTESILACVQVDGKTLIGNRKWGRDSREYYPQLSASQGKSIPARYDDRSFWLAAPDGKEIQFNQGNAQDQFHQLECTAEIHKQMLEELGDVKKPASVPLNAVLIPEGGRFFWHYYSWVACSLDAAENDDICTYWDKSGKLSYEHHVVSDRDRKPVPDVDLQIEPYATRRFEVHLRNGVSLVSDGRARINGKLVSESPKP